VNVVRQEVEDEISEAKTSFDFKMTISLQLRAAVFSVPIVVMRLISMKAFFAKLT